MEQEKQTNDSARPAQGRASFFPPVKDQLIFWGIAAAGIAADLLSKKAVFEWLGKLEPPEYRIIDGLLSFHLAVNPGAAFGIAADKRFFLTSISAVALAVVVWSFMTGRAKNWFTKLALPLFFAGIVGNLYDRLFNYGMVRDFIDAYYQPWGHWPTFNIADSMLCIAVGLLLISGFLQSSNSKNGN